MFVCRNSRRFVVSFKTQVFFFLNNPYFNIQRMDLMDIQDLTSIDINELGIRPFGWIDDENDIDFNDTTNDYFGKEKLIELNNGKHLTGNEGEISMLDEDDSNYEIDPETGNYIVECF